MVRSWKDVQTEGHELLLNFPEILGGMLDVEPVIYRGHKRENFDVQKAKVLRFGARWKGFDFTKKNRDATSSSDSD